LRLFVSYAHVDAVLIAELAKRLSEGGLEPWWDDRLEVGDDWKNELRGRISACQAFLYAISADSVESQWCRWELDQAIALSKFIVPIVVRTGASLPRAIAGLQYLDFSNGLADQGVAGLVDRLVRLHQNGALDPSAGSGSPHGSPSRFVQHLPRTYRTVAQGYLRPESPAMHRFPWPDASGAEADRAKDSRIVGIDFGTTTSAVAHCERGALRLIPNNRGDEITPSAVAIALDGTALVGRGALEFLLQHPERGVVEPKRLLGREVAQEFGGAVVLEIDGVSYRPVDFVALVLQKLRFDVSAHFGEPVRKAVLTAPAHFDPTQLAALSHAAQLAGWEVLRLVAEPVAACLGQRQRLQEHQILVYDLGGGTFDVSAVDMDDGVCLVLAVNGDTALGGVDFDRVIVAHCVAQFAATTGIDLSGNAAALIRIREAAEQAKIELSSARAVTVAVPFIASGPAGPLHLDVPLTRIGYNELTHELVARTIELTRITLEDSVSLSTGGSETAVLVVGRAARTPSVRSALEDLFQCRILAAPDHAVALGAGVQAGILSGEQKDLLLLDVLSHTLRVQVAGNRTVPGIVRHTTIPTRQTLKLVAQNGERRKMLVRVLSGESSWPDRNMRLLELEVPLADQPRSGRPHVDLEFDVDANAILNVTVLDSGGARLAKGTVGLRCPDPASTNDLGQDPPDDYVTLPLIDSGFEGKPLPRTSWADVGAVQRWIAENVAALLRANERGNLPTELPGSNLFPDCPLEREMIVDLMEQRLSLDLRRVRYSRSIETMAQRVVAIVREQARTQ